MADSNNQMVKPVKASQGRVRLTAATIGRDNRPGTTLSEDEKRVTEQSFIDRVRAYVPLEVLAFFIFVNSMIGDDQTLTPEQMRAAGYEKPWPTLWSNSPPLTPDDYVALATLAVGILATIIFVRTSSAADGRQTWRVQAVVSVLAFLVWGYAIRAEAYYVLDVPFAASVSGFLLGTFTLFSGLIVPVEPDSAPPAEDPPPDTFGTTRTHDPDP